MASVVNPIPLKYMDLMQEETKSFLHLATIMADGTPQVTPVWFDYDGERVRINTVRGRVKDRNMQKRPHVAGLIVDPANHYRYIQIRGTIVESTEEGADDHIRALNLKYHGKREYPIGDQTRVTYIIRIDHVDGHG
jgi:PPOX class probable F420-dependent enzyme